VGRLPGVKLQNATEVSLASEWHLRPALDLESEVAPLARFVHEPAASECDLS